MQRDLYLPAVSIITPMHNAAQFLQATAESVLAQTYRGPLEWCVYDDGSTDNSRELLLSYESRMKEAQIRLVLTGRAPSMATIEAEQAEKKQLAQMNEEELCAEQLEADDENRKSGKNERKKGHFAPTKEELYPSSFPQYYERYLSRGRVRSEDGADTAAEDGRRKRLCLETSSSTAASMSLSSSAVSAVSSSSSAASSSSSAASSSSSAASSSCSAASSSSSAASLLTPPYDSIKAEKQHDSPTNTDHQVELSKVISTTSDSNRDGDRGEQQEEEEEEEEEKKDVIGGPGYARNHAVSSSSGKFLCFLDADDIMMPERVTEQVREAESVMKTVQHGLVLIGTRFVREPEDSTSRYTRWLNSLTQEQLYTQRHVELTVILPTWFTTRAAFDAVGGFPDKRRYAAEDLVFFYLFLRLGGILRVVEGPPLLIYRYTQSSVSSGVSRWLIWDIRVREIQYNLIDGWDKFSIWNAGREGRRFYRSLRPGNQKKLVCFLDVGEKKLKAGYYRPNHNDSVMIPIRQPQEYVLPIILCIKLDLTEGQFEAKLAALNLREGIDYFHFC